MGASEHLTSISVPASFLHQSSQTLTDKTSLDLHRDRIMFPSFHPHLDTRAPLSLAPEPIRAEHPVTQCWNQQGGSSFSLSWGQFQTDERFLFAQQPWDVNPHHHLDWLDQFLDWTGRTLTSRGRHMTGVPILSLLPQPHSSLPLASVLLICHK